MAYGYKQGLDSFWHVQTKYDNTKPMVSKYHTKQDNLRPAGRNRSRKWEHIRKLSETCYAICDGQNGDPIFSSNWRTGGIPLPPMSIEDTYNLSPIVWEIMEQPDGSYLETIKIRNGTGDYGHNSRYTFLSEFLPDGMNWIQATNGRQYIRVGKVYYLPKSKSVDELRWDNYYTHHKTTYDFQREDDQKYLKFGRTTTMSGDGPPMTQWKRSTEWKLISPEFVPVNPKFKIDKERKKELKPYINEFWNWALAVGGTLHTSDSRHVHECIGILRQHRVVTSNRWSSNVSFNPSNVQKILKEPHNELRVQLLTVFMGRWGVRQAIQQDDIKKLRATYNAWINNACGLVTKTKGE
jgi:hypothetical protein